jgi:3-methylfumaryl-CoA hydratase
MMNIEHLNQWVGKTETINDTIDLAACQRMEATLDQPPLLKENDPLPPLWHWCWFNQPVRQSLLGRDGHPEKGEFLPPVALPRRMWAGGRLTFHAALPIGAEAQKISTIKSIEAKQGRTGPLCFVTVEHRLEWDGILCLVEEHDIVYREDPKPDDKPVTPPQAEGGTDFSRTINPSPTLLFRYSALTFNGHRIHYDRDYCRDVEAYPGLVFHGPLTATLLAGLAVRNNPGRGLKRFEFRAISPIFDTDTFEICGRMEDDRCQLQAILPNGALAMKAVAEFG